MNTKSLNFISQRIESGLCKGVNSKTYDFMKEIDFVDSVKLILQQSKSGIILENNEIVTNIKINFENSKTSTISVKIKYDPDADFEYFTMAEALTDGTIYINELISEILNRMLSVKTCYIPTKPLDAEYSIGKYNVCYTVGNFIFAVGTEHSQPQNKPWLNEIEAIMLPIKSEFVKRKVMKDE